MEVLSEELKRNIRESLVYALLQVTDYTQRRLTVQEFFHSLNRKHWLLNHEVEAEIERAIWTLSQQQFGEHMVMK